MTQTDHPSHPDLEQQLTELTQWKGESPDLWRTALAATSAQPDRSFMSRLRELNRSQLAAAVIAITFIGIIGLAILGSNVGSSRKVSPAFKVAREKESTFGAEPGRTYGIPSISAEEAASPAAMSPPPPPSDLPDTRTHFNDGGKRSSKTLKAEPDAAAQSARVVVRKANIELRSKDVRAAFFKSSMLISEARGEYVENSSLTGSADTPGSMYAMLTLRVAAGRLGEVLNQLRDLGEVASESSGADDITAQVVDVEARLRNEQRVETELLELLAARKDAPLKEILELRDQIGNIRERIEQLTAQRDRFSKLASLATILVIIREPTDPFPHTPTDARGGLGNYFGQRLDTAWKNGLIGLTNSLAWIVNVIVGGAIWWLVVLITAVTFIRLLRRPIQPKPQGANDYPPSAPPPPPPAPSA